ncbi:MAG: hemerythrin domain-containing protein [Rikenellaceae bacterium]
MHKIKKYNPTNTMSELICDNYPMLLVMSRFGIDLGFAEGTIAQVCQTNNVDLDTFLAVVNTLIAQNQKEVTPKGLSINSLIDYLHNSHSYFLEYRLPTIRQELIEALGSKNDAAVVILSYYDEYVAQVNEHMMHEEKSLFPSIKALVSGEKTTSGAVEIDSKHHHRIEEKLSELKNILIKYYPAKSTNELNNVLYDIFSCERDLASHNSLEEVLLIPAIKEFEAKKTTKS